MLGVGSAEYIPLTERPVPPAVTAQLGNFTLGSIRAKEEGRLNEAPLNEDAPVVAVDVGGDSLTVAVMAMQNGKPTYLEILADLKGVKYGQGYMGALEAASVYAQEYRLPVGVSFAGPLEGTKLLAAANLPEFQTTLDDRYDGDFANLFPTLAAGENDAIAGIRAGLLYARQISNIKNALLVINGSGENTAVSIDGVAWSMESGHVEVVDELNPLGQTVPCGTFGGHVCVERVAGGKAGIEDLWEQQTHTALDGRGIEAQALQGNTLAAELYDNSAVLTAHLVLGVARVFELDLSDGQTAVVGHGGTFKYPEYGARVRQALGVYAQGEPPLHMTHEFSPNACLDGAALGALANSGPRWY